MPDLIATELSFLHPQVDVPCSSVRTKKKIYTCISRAYTDGESRVGSYKVNDVGGKSR